MGLPKAIKAHSEGNLDLAAAHYKRSFDAGEEKPSLFQNYGALLRSIGNIDEAKQVYEKGLLLHPKNIGIISNYSNLVRDNLPITALIGYLSVLEHCLLSDNPDLKQCKDCFANLVEVLRSLDSKKLSLAFLKTAINHVGVTPDLLRSLLLLQDARFLHLFSSGNSDKGNDSLVLLECINACLETCETVKKSSLYFAVASHYLQLGDSEQALLSYRQATDQLKYISSTNLQEQEEAQKLVEVNSWNMSCVLLKLQRFSEGWDLFEYGLRTPANGPQRWQRALTKPFSATDIPIWRGESLVDKTILVLEEQGIGDGMMFLTLIPKIIQEAQQVILYISKRIYTIYLRSLRKYIDAKKLIIYSKSSEWSGLPASSFDYQTPIGSICSHRFKDVESFAPSVPILIPNKSNRENLLLPLKKMYPKSRFVGISWRGGGRGERIKHKSPPLTQFVKALQNHENIVFISLQYGSVVDDLSFFNQHGVYVHHDKSIDPLTDMDSWLDLVSLCDSVLSVANTTVHGSGGLNIPTLCILGLKSDWRWFDDPRIKRSYWYPSVGIARATKHKLWEPALLQARHWLKSGSPYPEGLTHTDVR